MNEKENEMVTVIIHNITEEQKALIKESGKFNGFLGIPMEALTNTPLELTKEQAEYLQSIGVDLEIEKSKDNEIDETKEKDDKPLTENEKETMKETVEKILTKLGLPQKAVIGISNVYTSAVWRSDLEKPNFLSEKLADSDLKLTNMNMLHGAILEAIKNQDNIEKMNEIGEKNDVALESAEIAEGKLNLRVPKLLTELDSDSQEKAKAGAKDKLKSYIKSATEGRSSIDTLIVIGDIDKYIESLKHDAKVNLEQNKSEKDDDANIVNLFLSQNEIKEMPEIMKAVNEATQNVSIDLESINWNNPIEREVAFELLERVQSSMEEIGAKDTSILDKISFDFQINTLADVETYKRTCERLGTVANTETTDIAASIEINPDIAKQVNDTVEDISEKYGVEIEDSEEIETNSKENEAYNKKQGALDEVSKGATSISNEVLKEMLNEIGQEKLDPGYGNTED